MIFIISTLVMNMHAKFDVSSCNRCRDMERVLRFAYSIYNFHGSTMTIKGISQVSIAIVKAFIADFWPKIWLGHVTCE